MLQFSTKRYTDKKEFSDYPNPNTDTHIIIFLGSPFSNNTSPLPEAEVIRTESNSGVVGQVFKEGGGESGLDQKFGRESVEGAGLKLEKPLSDKIAKGVQTSRLRH